MDDLYETMLEYLECPTWEEAECIVREHQDLLSPQAATLLASFTMGQPAYTVECILLPHADLLTRCRDVGVDQAFAEKRAPLSVVPPTLLDSLYKFQAANDRESLFATICDHPELRPALKQGPIFGREMVTPQGFEEAVKEIRRLQQAGLSDSEAVKKAIAVYEGILERLQKEPRPAFQAAIENDLAGAYLRAGDFDAAIVHTEAALQFFRADTVPLEYAFTQRNLGKLYQSRKTDDWSTNLQKAIACYQAALEIYTPGAALDEHVTTLSLLGTAFMEFEAEDRSRNVQQAIDYFQRALPFVGKSTPNRAILAFNLGEAFRQLLVGDREVNLQKAIGYYETALQVHRPHSEPHLYSRIQAGLAAAYHDLACGTDVESLGQAVRCYQEAMHTAKSALAAQDYETLRHDADECFQQWLLARECHGGSTAVSKSGNTVTRQSEIGQLTDLMNQLFRETTSNDDRDRLGQAVGAMMSNMLGRHVDAQAVKGFEAELSEMSRLQNALPSYPGAAEALVALARKTLQCLNPGDNLWVRFHVLNFCGVGYRNLPTGDAGSNLTNAIACFEEALKLRSPERAPDEYAPVLNNLGNAYRNLLAGDRTANLARAIGCYEEAIRLTSPETDPHAYGRRQLNLGTAYADLPTGDQDANLDKAVACYEEALRHLSPDVTPLEYAGGHENLGLALLQKTSGDRRANVARALRGFQEALRYRPAESVPVAHAQAQYHKGILYLELAREDDDEAKGLAIGCLEEGLRILQPEHAPRLYASLLCGLAESKTLCIDETDLEGEAQALQHFENALRLITPESAPAEYAEIQAKLAQLLARKSMRELERAAQAQKRIRRTADELGISPDALTVFNPDAEQALAEMFDRMNRSARIFSADTWPRECRKTNETLGRLEGSLHHWQEALVRYRVALQAADRLYRAGLSQRSKMAEAAANASLHRHAAFVAAQAGEPDLAWKILERGKTRLLTEALRLGVPRPAGVPDDDWYRFVRAAGAVRLIHSDRTADDFSTNEPFRTREEASRAAESALDEAIRRIRNHTVHFLSDIDLITVRRFLNADTVLLSFCVCNFGSMVLIVDHDSNRPVSVVDLPGFNQSDLDHVIQARRSGRTTEDGWLASFREMDPDTWMLAIDRVLKLVGERLLRPVTQTLPPSIKRLVLLPSSALSLLPLHAALLSEDPPVRVCDRFLVSYAPSAEVLLTCYQRASVAAASGVYQTVNPTEDAQLPYAATEAEGVAALIPDRFVHRGREATKEAVATGVRNRAYVQFICHAFYEWDEPIRSGLRLADGDLTLADLQAGIVDLTGTRLVLLSACETGITDVISNSPEEYVGLPAGFLMAGAPCLVSSLWQVSDISTAILMVRFAQLHFTEGFDIVAALAQAQKWLANLTATAVAEYAEAWLSKAMTPESAALIREDVEYYLQLANRAPTERPFVNPYYWAAFSVTGI